LLLLLSATGRLARMREFLWIFVLTLMACVSVSWLFPAESAWAHFHMTDRVDAYHLADFTALRAGRLLAIPWPEAIGLVTFPSFHAAMGLTLIYATRGIRFVFPASLVLNLLMIASTPTEGGHYLVDVIAGLAVVPVVILALRGVIMFEDTHDPITPTPAPPALTASSSALTRRPM
jgi:membrane-associated phospholipid phosphatase